MDKDSLPAWLKMEDEGLVYVIAHEAFHYLRRTKPIDRRNVEIDADTYAEEMLGDFREHRDGS
jgi:hypothetical protein